MRTISLDMMIMKQGKIEKDVHPRRLLEMPDSNKYDIAAKDDAEVKNEADIKDDGTVKEARTIAEILHRAVALSDAQVFSDINEPRYTTVDYYRMACHLLFRCHRCGNCCTTGDPIRLRLEDASAIARHLKIPLNKALKKYTIADPVKSEVLNFKHILPCKFYDTAAKGCKIYGARPWSCRIFPFLGIYGNEDKVIVKQSCPGSVETMKILTDALLSLEAQPPVVGGDAAKVKEAKRFLRAALNSI